MPLFQVTLTPPESKRLIARAITRLPEVQKALRDHTVLITLGTTNAYIAEELTGEPIDKTRYVAGYIDGETKVTLPETRYKEIVLRQGKQVEEWDPGELTSNDVVFKGANALDPDGVAGVMMSHPMGGTVGRLLGIVMARGVQLIIPVGLEKSVPHSVPEAAKIAGAQRITEATGDAVGLMPLHGKVFTEIEALKELGALEAVPLGIGGGGHVTIVFRGPHETWKQVLSIKG